MTARTSKINPSPIVRSHLRVLVDSDGRWSARDYLEQFGMPGVAGLALWMADVSISTSTATAMLTLAIGRGAGGRLDHGRSHSQAARPLPTRGGGPDRQVRAGGRGHRAYRSAEATAPGTDSADRRRGLPRTGPGQAWRPSTPAPG